MKITGTYEAFKEWMSHETVLARSTFFYQTDQTGNKITDILVDGNHFAFTPANQPTEAEFRLWASGAIKVSSWTL